MKKILVHIGLTDTRAAIIGNEQLVELFIEKSKEELLGNIYTGKVINVLPGMEAAFIDIGIGKNAFLYVNDAIPLNNGEIDENINIKNVLIEGQHLLVQVLKEPIGNKGPRVTTHISLAGRFLVYMPEANYVGISRRITGEVDRDHLKEIGESLKSENEGLIIRTVAFDSDKKHLENDLNFLRNLWQTIKIRSNSASPPSLIHKDLDLGLRLVRDLLAEDVSQFIVDNGYEFKRIKEMVQLLAPQFVNRMHLYSGKTHIFDAFNIQSDIDKTTKRKIWLKSGGYLIIDRTEALTVIDVNTGKYIGQSNLADTVLKTNLEAAVEIAKQLRLRDIGGIIIIDFIDMGEETHKVKVLAVLEHEMKKDRTKSNILGLTQLGLVEMTRKKVRQSIDSMLLKPCPFCEGVGRVISEDEVIDKIEREIIAYKNNNTVENLIIEVNPYLSAHLFNNNRSAIKRLEEISSKKITIKENNSYHFHQYSIQISLN